MPSGLAARIIGFLSIALLPIGAVAYFQTAQLNDETRARTELSLVALTEAAASGERQTILRALGNAQALGATLDMARMTPEQCRQTLRDYLSTSGEYTFVGVMPRDGMVHCSSAPHMLDFSTSPHHSGMIADPRPNVLRNDNPEVSETPVLIVSEPFFRQDEFQGYVTLSFPASGLRQGGPQIDDRDLLEVVTFNSHGQVLSSRSRHDEALRLLPDGQELAALSGVDAHSFEARSADGQKRYFAVAPLVPGLVYALSVWPGESQATAAFRANRMAQVLPFMMWAASVVVAFLAINRLVIRHITTLSQQMRAFARTRRMPEATLTADMARELRDMESDFLHMADAIVRDEAQLENTLHEKNILLKEVHHRVKNNLQLISSIMNMQIRQSGSDETRAVLRRLQERIRGLATIHRRLYETEDLSHVEAGLLLQELIEQMTIVSEMARAKVSIETELEDIEVYPDQAVPLSLLTAEALTNAGKYIQPGADGVPRLSVCFRKIGEKRAEIEIVNSINAEMGVRNKTLEPGTIPGLGERLIRAFATQMGGELTQGPDGDVYRVHVRFALSEFKPQVVDY